MLPGQVGALPLCQVADGTQLVLLVSPVTSGETGAESSRKVALARERGFCCSSVVNLTNKHLRRPGGLGSPTGTERAWLGGRLRSRHAHPHFDHLAICQVWPCR